MASFKSEVVINFNVFVRFNKTNEILFTQTKKSTKFSLGSN